MSGAIAIGGLGTGGSNGVAGNAGTAGSAAGIDGGGTTGASVGGTAGTNAGGAAGASAGGTAGDTAGTSAGGAAGATAGAGGAPINIVCAANIEDPTATIQPFESPIGTACTQLGMTGSKYTCDTESSDPAYTDPTIVEGAAPDPRRFLRLLRPPVLVGASAQDTITFEAAAQARPVIFADFDFRVIPDNLYRADGLGFALLDAASFPNPAIGTQGPCYAAEEPNFVNSIGVGFDIYRSPNDIGNEFVRINYSNSVSLHYSPTPYVGCDTATLASKQFDVAPIPASMGPLGTGLDMAGTLWNHARVVVQRQGNQSAISVRLTGEYGDTVTVADSVTLPVPMPYAPRVWFGARAGGESSTFDLANVRVHSLNTDESGVAFSKREWRVDETGAHLDLKVLREGFTGSALVVQYFTEDGGAKAGRDYKATCGQVTFGPGETSKDVRIDVLDDAEDETTTAVYPAQAQPVPISASESFLVRLSTVDPKGRILGPAVANVTIVDDEAARRFGGWGPVSPSGIVAVHAALLPNAKLLLQDRLSNVVVSEVGVANTKIAGPGYDSFCNGAAFLADGSLLVSGGHDDPLGAAMQDGIGVKQSSLFNATTNTWSPLPVMNLGRWYPTVTTQSDGTALLLSGSYEADFEKNPLPQIYVSGAQSYRDLTAAAAQTQNTQALGEDLYPRTFALPNARSIKVGPDPTTWLLDTAGVGAWTQGPTTNYLGGRIYGPAVLRGRTAMLAGGGWLDEKVAPTNTVEELDLGALQSAAAWVNRPAMFYTRRQHNATVLPDGRVFVTHGCSGAGFSTMSTAVLPTEMYVNNEWLLMPPARVPRCYHSIALLMPDGSVLTGGGGEGAAVPSSQNNFETYYPDYFYRARPAIGSAPSEVKYATPFVVQTTAVVSKVTVVRLPAVTHSFDENTRYAELPFTTTSAGASVTAPNDGWLPPGHYLLFVLDQTNTPSQGTLIHLDK